MKYKIGDRVRIRPNNKGPVWEKEYKSILGKEVVIENVVSGRNFPYVVRDESDGLLHSLMEEEIEFSVSDIIDLDGDILDLL